MPLSKEQEKLSKEQEKQFLIELFSAWRSTPAGQKAYADAPADTQARVKYLGEKFSKSIIGQVGSQPKDLIRQLPLLKDDDPNQLFTKIVLDLDPQLQSSNTGTGKPPTPAGRTLDHAIKAQSKTIPPDKLIPPYYKLFPQSVAAYTTMFNYANNFKKFNPGNDALVNGLQTTHNEELVHDFLNGYLKNLVQLDKAITDEDKAITNPKTHPQTRQAAIARQQAAIARRNSGVSDQAFLSGYNAKVQKDGSFEQNKAWRELLKGMPPLTPAPAGHLRNGESQSSGIGGLIGGGLAAVAAFLFTGGKEGKDGKKEEGMGWLTRIGIALAAFFLGRWGGNKAEVALTGNGNNSSTLVSNPQGNGALGTLPPQTFPPPPAGSVPVPRRL